MTKIICISCKKEIIKNSWNQKYCKECREQKFKERHKEQSKRFHKENPTKYLVANRKRYYNNLEKSRKYARDYHNRNKEKINERVREIRRINKTILVNYKGGECEKCGYNGCLGALEFHHVDGKKEFEIGKKTNTLKGIDKLKKEVDKCELLCANCHKEKHYNMEE